MISCAQVDKTLVVELQGKTLDARTVHDFRREIDGQLSSHDKVVLDLSRLTFIDSSGLGSLLSCLRQLSSRGGDMKLCSVGTQVRAVFQLVRMHRLFEIHNTQAEALQAFSG